MILLKGAFLSAHEHGSDDVTQILKHVNRFDPLCPPSEPDGNQVQSLEYLQELPQDALQQLAVCRGVAGRITAIWS